MTDPHQHLFDIVCEALHDIRPRKQAEARHAIAAISFNLHAAEAELTQLRNAARTYLGLSAVHPDALAAREQLQRAVANVRQE